MEPLEIGAAGSESALDKEIALLLSVEREIQCHLARAISERVAAHVTAHKTLTLVHHSELLNF